ncbi:MAG: TIGR01777 family oxidoreductase, partial [Nitriliruptoraceae bacterium]
VTTRLLADACTRLDAPPAVFVSASAVGFYGDRGDEVLTEDAGAGDDFLAAVCRQWESAARPAADAGIRVVHPRTGVVIAAQGPLIDKVRLPFRLGIGGRIGSGRQYVPWIARADHVRAVRHLLVDDLEGPVNVVGPEPVTNRELTRALGKAFHRPAVLPIPVLAVRALYGQMGVALATVSQRVVPQRLVDSGFAFSVASLDDALAVALGD